MTLSFPWAPFFFYTHSTRLPTPNEKEPLFILLKEIPFSYWQHYRELTPLTFFTYYLNLAVMEIHDLICYRKTKSMTRFFSDLFIRRSVKFLKDMRHILLRNTNSCINNMHHELISTFFCP